MKQIIREIAGILGTLAETPEGCSESTLYLALGMDLGKWHKIRDIMLRAKYITISANWVKPTEMGVTLGEEVNAELRAQAE